MKLALRIAFATLLTFALTEGGIRLYRIAIGQTPPHPDPSVAAEWSWAREHLDAGAPDLGSQASPDPLLGWRTFVKRRRADGGPRVGIERTPGIPRVVLVGDSFTREIGRLEFPFEPGRTFRPDWEVVNLAVQGYGAGQTWLRFRESGRDYAGDVAIFGLYVRDYFRTFRSFRGFAKPTFALEDGELVVQGIPVISPDALYEAYRSGERRIGRPGRSWVIDFLRQRDAVNPGRGDLRPDDLAVFAAILEAFRDDAVASGACPLLVIFPTRPDDYDGTIFEQVDREARAIAARLDLPFVALAEPLYGGASLAARDALFGEGQGAHMSERGRAAVARALDAAFAAYAPGRCFATRADGSVPAGPGPNAVSRAGPAASTGS